MVRARKQVRTGLRLEPTVGLYLLVLPAGFVCTRKSTPANFLLVHKAGAHEKAQGWGQASWIPEQGQTQESSQRSLSWPCSSGLPGSETAVYTQSLATEAVSSGPSDRKSLQEINICLRCSPLASNLMQSSYLWRFQGKHHRILLEHLPVTKGQVSPARTMPQKGQVIQVGPPQTRKAEEVSSPTSQQPSGASKMWFIPSPRSGTSSPGADRQGCRGTD